MAKIKHTVDTRIWSGKIDRYITIPVEITIDLETIAFELGKKAYHSKHGKSRIMRGAITVTKK